VSRARAARDLGIRAAAIGLMVAAFAYFTLRPPVRFLVRQWRGLLIVAAVLAIARAAGFI